VCCGEEAAVNEIITKQRSVDEAGSANRSTVQSNNSREWWMKIMRMRELYIVNEIEGGLVS
jgi:hypothetical protein